MSATAGEQQESQRARDWWRAHQAAVCDVSEPWAHGTVLRAARYPTYYSFNLVRVEDDPAMDATELAAFADRALAGLEHRRIDFEPIEPARERRAELETMGYKATALLWMRHTDPTAVAANEGFDVEQAPYEAADELRHRWQQEDFPDSAYDESFRTGAREVAMTRDARVLVVREGEEVVAFAQVERSGEGAEITKVYVHPDHRGGGRGTAMTRAAIRSAAGVRDLWIAADDEDRPKRLYERLGFKPVYRSMELVRPR
ncbi:MAG TPA: GNAT family N-acetyltransferase [Solirubrobacteraceae bacterium]|jgi:ribosomal protein S18 acetylase RimI-like enzyme|nr:GNAT family N-acetyltransferase [Solirubrobacteraceae bacterium]